jgi:ZIP family zinc transporter
LITFELVVLGFISGFTIFLGLPVAILKQVSARIKGFLNAITIGVLIYILLEVLPTAKSYVENSLIQQAGTVLPFEYIFALIAGVLIGIFGLVGYERQFVRIRQKRALSSSGSLGTMQNKSMNLGEAEARGSQALTTQAQTQSTFQIDDAKRIALSIAIGIGVHNFTEGLAIGQAYSSTLIALSYFLVIGFAIHNTTEGFGIAAPMAGFRPSMSYLALLGVIGGGPTLVGAIVGGAWSANFLLLTFILAAAAGALIYVMSGMFYVARRQTSNELFMLGLFIGFLVAFGTDMWLVTMGM